MDGMFQSFFLFLTLFVCVGQCLECHECVTIVADTCLDPYNVDDNADNVNECSEGSHCVKYKTVIHLRDSGYINGWRRDSIVVTRVCEPTHDLPTGCVRWQGAGGFTIKCRCDTDGCNTAGHHKVDTVPLLLSLLAFLWLVR